LPRLRSGFAWRPASWAVLSRSPLEPWLSSPLREAWRHAWQTICPTLRELPAASDPRSRRHRRRCHHRRVGYRHGPSRQEHVAITTHDGRQRNCDRRGGAARVGHLRVAGLLGLAFASPSAHADRRPRDGSDTEPHRDGRQDPALVCQAAPDFPLPLIPVVSFR